MLNATNKKITEMKDKITEMTEHNFDDDKYVNEALVEAKWKHENLLEAKMQHKFNIEEKFDGLKSFDPTFANALLEKYPELKEFLTPAKVVTPCLLENEENK